MQKTAESGTGLVVQNVYDDADLIKHDGGKTDYTHECHDYGPSNAVNIHRILD